MPSILGDVGEKAATENGEQDFISGYYIKSIVLFSTQYNTAKKKKKEEIVNFFAVLK